MIRKTAPIFLAALLAHSLALAEDSVQWGSSEKTYRQPVEGMKGYYEPEKAARNGDVVSFKVFRSADPAITDEVGSYMVNCDTHEYVTIVKGRAEAPVKLLAGEQLYPISSKLCDWAGKGFLKNFW